MNTAMTDARLIETDAFPFEFLSRLAERESWRKEIHRPVYHVHKWWANRLGSVFRGILLGCAFTESHDLAAEFYRSHALSHLTVLDPFMGSGTTVGEAHKLGLTALGRDINPVAVGAVRTAMGPLDRRRLIDAFKELSRDVGRRIRGLYESRDAKGRRCEVLYYFWVMQALCPKCRETVDLFPSWVVARNAAPRRKSEVRLLCPGCGDIFAEVYGNTEADCPSCERIFDPTVGAARGKSAVCRCCGETFPILDAVARTPARPPFRLYGKLVLTCNGSKEYLPATGEDHAACEQASDRLRRELAVGTIVLPDLELEHGYNTRQAMGYGFRTWRDFFNDRQLLALGWLRRGIEDLPDSSARRALLTLFSGVLEFNNLFASYKGEGTGAVRHMFSHHILKPERTPIEANVWGTPKSSGSFSGLFRSRLLRACDYRDAPAELNGRRGPARVCSPPFSGRVEPGWPEGDALPPRAIYLSCGDSAETGLPAESVDFVVTDPPFFDNVHYSELADFFHAWQRTFAGSPNAHVVTTRHVAEVQDTDATHFSEKLARVFRECRRVLKDDGLLVFTYHHSRADGWESLARAILGAGFTVVNSHPVKAEMSVATPKSQAKTPIQLDIIIVCRKQASRSLETRTSVDDAIESARMKLRRLRDEGFHLSRNDRKIVMLGQLLTTLETAPDLVPLLERVETELDQAAPEEPVPRDEPMQRLLF